MDLTDCTRNVYIHKKRNTIIVSPRGDQTRKTVSEENLRKIVEHGNQVLEFLREERTLKAGKND